MKRAPARSGAAAAISFWVHDWSTDDVKMTITVHAAPGDEQAEAPVTAADLQSTGPEPSK